MEEIIHPLDAKSDGLIESMKDPTSAEGMVFFHADEGKPLATPWQVALSRAILLSNIPIPEGHIVVATCRDEVSKNLSDKGRNWFEKLGSKEIHNL